MKGSLLGATPTSAIKKIEITKATTSVFVSFWFANNIAPIANAKASARYYDIKTLKQAFKIDEGVFYDGIEYKPYLKCSNYESKIINNGVVITSEYHGSYGNYIIINHNNGYYTSYAHMSKLISSVGDTVGKGQVIGLVGRTGRATGPHLHFEAWYGGAPYQGGTRFNPMELYR